jgi:hypothetical protein
LVAAALPNVTVAPDAKFVPVIVTDVPPATGPVFGLTLVTVVEVFDDVVFGEDRKVGGAARGRVDAVLAKNRLIIRRAVADEFDQSTKLSSLVSLQTGAADALVARQVPKCPEPSIRFARRQQVHGLAPCLTRWGPVPCPKIARSRRR